MTDINELDKDIVWDMDEEKLDLNDALALIAAFSLGENID